MATTQTNHVTNQINERTCAVKVLQGNVPAQGTGSGPATLPTTGQQWPRPR